MSGHFNVQDLDGFGCQGLGLAIGAAGALLQYVRDTQQSALPHIHALHPQHQDDGIIIDAATRRNLEIINNFSGGQEHTLCHVMDRTANPMGGRLLRRWLQQPLRDQQQLRRRHQAVESLRNPNSYEALHEGLHGVADIERILARVALKSARPRDLACLRDSLGALATIRKLLLDNPSAHIKDLSEDVSQHPQIQDLLIASIIDTPPVLIRDGGVIAPGYNAELDELRCLQENDDQFLIDLENRERQASGIATLKVGYNRVHGYYIEISRAQAGHAPGHYIRRQTLKNVERYITPELKEFETRILSSREKALALEKILYDELLEKLIVHLEKLQQTAAALAEIDVLSNFAERADSLSLSMPTLTDNPGIDIKQGRHLVVEQSLESPFIPNDLKLDRGKHMLVITGPNMGGKSTYMRQVALIVLLAHVGSLVPAEACIIGPIDRIFTRIGAHDDLASGRSTFMVEMIEAANILHNATDKSLVLMDEIGRGTSTFDGLSLAWACAHYLAEKTTAYTLFSTHYFELTSLPEHCRSIANVHLSAEEKHHQIAFLYHVCDGAADKSYGLQVAHLAGIPPQVIEEARQKLAELEQPGETHAAPTPQQTQDQKTPQTPRHAVLDELESLDPDSLSPRQALQVLYRLKHRL